MNNREIFLRHLAQTSPSPLLIEPTSAKGIRFETESGKTYIDLISGIAVSNVGHCHPEVVQAIINQSQKYMHMMVYGEFIQKPQTELAERILTQLPSQFENIYFVNSGSEAIDGAIKLAKKFTQKSGLISCRNSYHGSTIGALSIIGSEVYKSSFLPLLDHTRLINYNNIDDLAFIDNQTAAVIIEPVQAEAGVILPDHKFFEALRQKCDETGTLIIMDEVQTGFGRTGKMFGLEQTGIIPDIITLAKGMGGGMPIGAFVSSKKIMSVLMQNPILGHITTFGGHPVCCAASNACIQIIQNEALHTNADEKGKKLIQALNHPAIKEIRQIGLLIAIEFNDEASNFKVVDACLENGLLTDWFLFNSKCMRIAPPLIITNEECELFGKMINEIIGKTL